MASRWIICDGRIRSLDERKKGAGGSFHGHDGKGQGDHRRQKKEENRLGRTTAWLPASAAKQRLFCQAGELIVFISCMNR